MPLIVYYVLYFMMVGISLPFFPEYFRSLGLRSAEIGVVLAMGPTFALVAPPLWGALADRTRRPGLVLTIVSAGACLGLAAISVGAGFLGVLGAVALYSTFGASITTLIDTLALQRVSAQGGSYSRIRIWGSLGFVLSSLSFGFVVADIDRRVVLVSAALMAACALWSGLAFARAAQVEAAGPRPSWTSAWRLLQKREIALFLVATCLHWVACAPYHGILAIHFTAVGLPPRAISLSFGVGVASELLVLLTWPRWCQRVSPKALLITAFLASACRWWGMASTNSESLLIPLSLIHGLTFGAFYVASITHMANVVPPSLRASGQALFVAATFGVGGLVGFLSSLSAYDRFLGHSLFAAAGALELLPAAALALVSMPPLSTELKGAPAAPVEG